MLCAEQGLVSRSTDAGDQQALRGQPRRSSITRLAQSGALAPYGGVPVLVSKPGASLLGDCR